MSARYDAEWVSSLLDTKMRLGSLTPAELLVQGGLSEGMTVVDYGCGPGFLTLPAARVVGREGRVYAVDVEPSMVALVAERAAEAGLRNVDARHNAAGFAPLPDAVADFAICALVMHYPDGRDARLALARDMARLLAPGGRALVVQRALGEGGPSRRASIEDGRALLAEAGLDCAAPRLLVEGQYILLAARPPEPEA